MVRAAPEQACEPGFVEELRAKGHFQALVPSR